jgi:hypothetical protein
MTRISKFFVLQVVGTIQFLRKSNKLGKTSGEDYRMQDLSEGVKAVKVLWRIGRIVFDYQFRIEPYSQNIFFPFVYI